MSQSILILAGDDYEDLELQYPRLRLREAGLRPLLLGMTAGVTHRGKHGYPCLTDLGLADVEPDDHAGILLPGGWMPDKLRRVPAILDFVRHFDAAGKLVASICHGGWIAISAGVVKGRRYTGSPGIKDDLVNAGATFEDAEVVVDGHHVSSRKPDDLPAFVVAMLAVVGG